MHAHGPDTITTPQCLRKFHKVYKIPENQSERLKRPKIVRGNHQKRFENGYPVQIVCDAQNSGHVRNNERERSDCLLK